MDDYASRFLELRIKVDQNNVMLIKHVILKFVQELKSQIMSIVYVKNPATLNTAITIIRNVKGGLVMANESKQVYVLEDQITQLNEQVNALARERS